jgi:hypothetical protein
VDLPASAPGRKENEMKGKHTAEPWKTDKYGNLVDSNGKDVVFQGVTIASNWPDKTLPEANRDRAIACVNALEGINPEAVKDMMFTMDGILTLIGNVDHATKTGANDALARGEILNAIRDLVKHELRKARGEEGP